jgi:DNA-binding ferritin-like protein
VAQFSPLPPASGKARSYDQWGKDLATYLYSNRKYELLKSPTYKQFSRPGEAERDFRIRLALNVREQRDDLTEKLRQKYQVKIAGLEEQVRKAQQAVDREAEQQKQQTMQTVISVGSTLLGAFLGGKGGITAGTVGRATTAAKSAGRIMSQKEDVDRAKETVSAHQQRLAEIEAGFKAETDQLAAKGDPATEQLDTISIRPAKKDIQVRFVGLAWLPYWQSPDGKTTPAWQ